MWDQAVEAFNKVSQEKSKSSHVNIAPVLELHIVNPMACHILLLLVPDMEEDLSVTALIMLRLILHHSGVSKVFALN